MSESPDEIRREIEQTRNELGQTLEDIEERISPAKVKQRGLEAARERVQQVRGTAQSRLDEAGVSDKAQQAFDLTRGNPIGAGAAALAGGLLLGLILPKKD